MSRIAVVALLAALLAVAGAADAARPDDAGGNANGRGQPDEAGKPEHANGGNRHTTSSSEPNPTSSPAPEQAAEPAPAATEPAPEPAQPGPAAADASPGKSGQSNGQSGANAAPSAQQPEAPVPAPSASASPQAHAAVAAAHDDVPRTAVAPPPAPVTVATVPPATHDTPEPPRLNALAGVVEVKPGPAGNRLSWEAAAVPAGAQVQVWRQADGAWTPVATIVAGDTFVDASGLAGDDYKLTWTAQPVDAGVLASVGSALPLTAAPPAGWGRPGRWLALALMGSVPVVGLVRAVGTRRIVDTRVTDAHDLVTALAGLPNVEAAQLQRLAALGLRTVGQLRRLDPDAVAFWAGVPAATVRRWLGLVELLQWPALPAGAAERLALAGHTGLASLAAAAPADVLAGLRDTGSVEGPGLPADEADVAGWIVEARQVLGLVGTSPARFTWPAAAAR